MRNILLFVCLIGITANASAANPWRFTTISAETAEVSYVLPNVPFMLRVIYSYSDDVTERKPWIFQVTSFDKDYYLTDLNAIGLTNWGTLSKFKPGQKIKIGTPFCKQEPLCKANVRRTKIKGREYFESVIATDYTWKNFQNFRRSLTDAETFFFDVTVKKDDSAPIKNFIPFPTHGKSAAEPFQKLIDFHFQVTAKRNKR